MRWLDNFREPKVGGPAAIARLQEQCVLTNGQKVDYGLGVALDTYRALKRISHNGGDAGYRSEVMWFPDQELGVAVVSNLATFNPSQTGNKVAELFLAGKLADPPKPERTPRTFITLETAVLERFAGTYPLPAIEQVFETKVDRGKFWFVPPVGPPIEIQAVGPSHFYIQQMSADIEFTANCELTLRRFHRADAHAERGRDLIDVGGQEQGPVQIRGFGASGCQTSSIISLPSRFERYGLVAAGDRQSPASSPPPSDSTPQKPAGTSASVESEVPPLGLVS